MTPPSSPFKGKTGLRRIMNAAGYSWDGFCAAYKYESAFRQEFWLALVLVPECLLIEPTETESRETLDGFIAAMKSIKHEAETSPDLVKGAPYSLPVRRLDDVKAARELDLAYKPAA